ncbi:uncharacterized protein PgNI_02291 [Pyricularia grisea]|uniref:Uncharacterized protein n=1 Tax=Pyricularia grisea TaxID=148305 RepID=A0A6P8BKB5_PYRGI|nr:uncharacterized protein PgNI_02291 [Pyricularia grisea]TLD17017.1 hypothetical protein PgNI_02291 [Pyricularia grisea]
MCGLLAVGPRFPPWDRSECNEGKTLGWEGKMQHYHTFGKTSPCQFNESTNMSGSRG